jgi:UDP-N-acetylmuramoyl-L-alanyl-D-glutamate--2,6-diaminopimelate ligase
VTASLAVLVAGLGAERVALAGPLDAMVHAVELDARACRPGSVFVACRGRRADGHDFAADAVARGAVAVVGERPAGEVDGVGDAAYVQVSSSRRAAGLLAHALHGHPARGLPVVAVTGTSGKTTTAHLLAAILGAAGSPAAVVGTTGCTLGAHRWATPGTTPDGPALAAALADARARGARSVVVEASAQGLEQERLAGLRLDAAALLNLAREHLDHFPSLAAYAAAKERVRELLTPGGALVVGADDGWAASIRAPGRRRTFGRDPHADVRVAEERPDGLATRLVLTLDGTAWPLRLPLLGGPNALNAAAAGALALALGVAPSEVVAGLEATGPLAGRLEPVGTPGGALVVLDAAHCGAGLDAALRACRVLARERGGDLLCAVGPHPVGDGACRVDRGRAAGALADRVAVTAIADHHAPDARDRAIADVLDGIPPQRRSDVLVEPDRARCVEELLAEAGPRDVVLLDLHDVQPAPGAPRLRDLVDAVRPRMPA